MSAKPVLPAYSMNRSSFPRMYEDSIVGPLFRPWGEALLDRAQLEPAMSVLDVACGTGIVARLARRRLGRAARVVGVDVSAPMLEVAREIEPEIDWREGDAAALPVAPDEQFEGVLCQQGIQFFGDRDAAAAELRRVLTPGGLLAAAVWRSADEMPVFEALQRVAERHVGPIHDARYAFGAPDALKELLANAGFREVEVETTSLVCRFDEGKQFVQMNAMALLGMSGAQIGDEERERLLELVVAESLEATRRFFDGESLACEMRANVAAAR
jgi:ubiquinone/menaquinone biosynthesis C-methylase UbiE